MMQRAKRATMVAVVVIAATACSDTTPAPPMAGPGAQAGTGSGAALTVYSRDRFIAEPLFTRFQQQTGITIRARWGDPIKLAEQVITEGDNTAADVFYAPLSDALGTLSAAGRLATLADKQLQQVPQAYRSPQGTWVGTAGRAHVVFYNTSLLKEGDLPDTILGFTDPRWRGRIGWDPTSRSLQDVIAELTQLKGQDAARAWLQGIQANQPATIQGAIP